MYKIDSRNDFNIEKHISFVERPILVTHKNFFSKDGIFVHRMKLPEIEEKKNTKLTSNNNIIITFLSFAFRGSVAI